MNRHWIAVLVAMGCCCASYAQSTPSDEYSFEEAEALLTGVWTHVRTLDAGDAVIDEPDRRDARVYHFYESHKVNAIQRSRQVAGRWKYDPQENIVILGDQSTNEYFTFSLEALEPGLLVLGFSQPEDGEVVRMVFERK